MQIETSAGNVYNARYKMNASAAANLTQMLAGSIARGDYGAVTRVLAAAIARDDVALFKLLIAVGYVVTRGDVEEICAADAADILCYLMKPRGSGDTANEPAPAKPLVRFNTGAYLSEYVRANAIKPSRIIQMLSREFAHEVSVMYDVSVRCAVDGESNAAVDSAGNVIPAPADWQHIELYYARL